MTSRRDFLKLAGWAALAFPMLGKDAAADIQALEKGA